MLGEVRIVVASLYALLMAIDTFMELSGRYAKVNVRIRAFPYLENRRTVNTCLWGMVHTVIAFLSTSNIVIGFVVLYLIMGTAGMGAVKRLLRVLKFKQPE
jgi:hypothetical protein